jgi:hypothetical protein
MKLAIGQTVSGTYWNKGFDRHGYVVPVIIKPFENGVVIGFTKAGSPIISVTSGSLRFNVYRTKISEGQ